MAETMKHNGADAVPSETITTLRTSVGEFRFRQTESRWHLEIKVGNVRRVLGEYETDDAAILALRNRHSTFPPWDTMGRNAVAIQIDTPERWGRNGGRR